MRKDGEMKVVSKNDMKGGLLWNGFSMILMSLCGMISTMLIVLFYDAAALGVFNQVSAYYVVVSQISVWGIHMSILRNTPLFQDNINEQKESLISAVGIVIVISTSVSLGIWCFLAGSVNSEWMVSFVYVLPALVFFSINKVVLGFFNGASAMKTYAALQSLRSISIVAAVLFLAVRHVPYVEISKCFVAGELVVTVVNVILLAKKGLLSIHISLDWVRRHLVFGSKIILSNLVLELNTKIDVICLGWILNDDYLIGIYSFAALFAEGFYHIFVVVRRNINPLIALKYQKIEERKDDINTFAHEITKKIRAVKWLLYILIVIGYSAVCYIFNRKEYLAGIVPLAIICMGIALTAKSIIFGNFFSQIGKPEKESMINICTVMSNIAGNLFFIHFFDIAGAALATGLSYLVFACMLRVCSKRSEGILV
ncbi:MAG: polysaccharide biosynthesis C-terminal domain-containing protein [Candidatus Gastranaerophilales bacterium]|nr:polysaccharide biosynthesis C-terminal domain-containing protein [Candidatus Gastranaerophilales bacterium]